MEPYDNSQLAKPRSRRDFLTIATCGMGAVTVGAGVWGLGRAMSPSAAIVSAPELLVDLKDVPVGDQRKFMFDGKPVFVRHLTKDQVVEASRFDVRKLPDGLAQNANLVETASASVTNRTVSFNGIYTVLWGICPRGFCVPIFDTGDFGGWFCPCGGAHFDVFGRVHKGTSLRNMRIPRYRLSEQGVLMVPKKQGGISQEELDRLVFGSRS